MRLVKCFALAFCTLAMHADVSFAGCDSAPAPRPQSIIRFYDPEQYGRLGVKGLGDNLHILDEYRCYDLSFLRDKYLSIYFNGAINTEDADPTYIGALIVRAYSGKSYDQGPYTAYFYRNASNKDKSLSVWAQWLDWQADNATGAEGHLQILEDKYEPKEPLKSSNLADLMKQLGMVGPQAAGQLKQWHALVAGSENTPRIYYNTASSAAQWHLDSASESDNGQSYFVLKSYLIKYHPSRNPAHDVIFEAGAQNADCVYMKLVAPGDERTKFALQRENGNAEPFITLKMKQNASCRAAY